MSSHNIHKYDYWMRVGLQLELCVKDALLSILHNSTNDASYTGLPDDPSLLHRRMVTFKTTYQNILKKVVKRDQWDVLCPSNGLSYSKNWDITLIVLVIQYETTLSEPDGGWAQKSPKGTDQSKAAFCLRARELRNKVNHGSIDDILTHDQYTDYSIKINRILVGLKYKNWVLFTDLDTGSLKMYTRQTVKVLETKVSSLSQSVNDLEITKVDVNTANLNAVQSIADGNTATMKQLNVELISVKLQLRSMQSAADVTDDLKTGLQLVEKMASENKFDLATLKSDFQALQGMISDAEIHNTKSDSFDATLVTEGFTKDLETIKAMLLKTESNLDWKLNVNNFCQRLFAIFDHLDEDEFLALKDFCFKQNLIGTKSAEEIGKRDLCELIDGNGMGMTSNAEKVSSILQQMKKHEEIGYLEGFLPENRNILMSIAENIYDQVSMVLTTLRKYSVLFLLGILVLIYYEDLRDYYRYRWCIYGCIADSQFSFNFRAYRDPTQLNFVEGNVEFEWKKFQHHFPLIKPHPHKEMHYFLNTDRCILGDVRDVGNSFMKKRPVRGAEIFAVSRDCKEVWFHDDDEGRWKMYQSARNITCTKLGK